MYSINCRVRYSEIDENKRLDLGSVINYFQDCSTFQSEDLGIGLNWLSSRHLAWLLSSWQIVVNRFPGLGEEITVSTWANDFKSLYGTRNFMLKDKDGNVCAYANSYWIYMDMEKLRPVRIPAEIEALYQPEPRLDMDYASRKITLPDTEPVIQSSFPVSHANIDTNHHVNNGQYIKMAEGYLPKDFSLRQMRAEYKMSAVLNDIIVPYTYETDKAFYVSLANEQGKPFTVVEFTRNGNGE
ncbi:acyl-[acyl-carrier-protein] thioesterase [Anaerolentibacter hominis]|uniref:acyl-[acyl-carrier-protein] thioesterase n=1 Tax=Anaerolentibacter hominis TaxID=3079009 RepID=UPI0031B7F3A8